MKLIASEAATLTVVVAAVCSVLLPGMAGWQGSHVDRQTQGDLSRVADLVGQFHREAAVAKASLTTISVETASSSRVRIYPAVGPAQLVDVASGTTALGSNAVIHYSSMTWCVALTNPKGRIKTFHHHVNEGPGQGGCPGQGN